MITAIYLYAVVSQVVPNVLPANVLLVLGKMNLQAVVLAVPGALG